MNTEFIMYLILIQPMVNKHVYILKYCMTCACNSIQRGHIFTSQEVEQWMLSTA